MTKFTENLILKINPNPKNITLFFFFAIIFVIAALFIRTLVCKSTDWNWFIGATINLAVLFVSIQMCIIAYFKIGDVSQQIAKAEFISSYFIKKKEIESILKDLQTFLLRLSNIDKKNFTSDYESEFKSMIIEKNLINKIEEISVVEENKNKYDQIISFLKAEEFDYQSTLNIIERYIKQL